MNTTSRLYPITKKIKYAVKYFPPVASFRESRMLGGNNSTVFMLHRTFPYDREKLLPNEMLKVSPEYLERIILKMRRTHDIISLDELTSLLQNGKTPRRPVALFTFDDGYRDNLTHALPIFEKYHVPFTVYVTPCFPEKTAFLWWFLLEEIICANDTVTLTTDTVPRDLLPPLAQTKYRTKTKQQKIDAYMMLRDFFLALPPQTVASTFSAVFSRYQKPAQQNYENLLLNWDEVRTLAVSQYCTIGAHTVNHVNLHLLTDTDTLQELSQSRTIIEEKIGKPVNHFAFPFGTAHEVTAREIELAQKAGFVTAALSYGGALDFSKNGAAANANGCANNGARDFVPFTASKTTAANNGTSTNANTPDTTTANNGAPNSAPFDAVVKPPTPVIKCAETNNAPERALSPTFVLTRTMLQDTHHEF